MVWAAAVAYNDLPPLPPAEDIETKAVLKATVEARAALAALDQAARRITNPTVLINSIPLLEAQASSEIENIVTTADDLFKFAQDESAASNPATKETLSYRKALFAGVDLIRARPLSVTTATEVFKAVQKMLGHASAAMTLDVYADLFDNDLDAVGDALSAEGDPGFSRYRRRPGRAESRPSMSALLEI